MELSSVQLLSHVRLFATPWITRPPCPSPTPGVYSNPRPSSRWCHPAILYSVVPFSSCPQSLPVLGSFPMSQLFAWGGQTIGVSALTSVLPFFFFLWNIPWNIIRKKKVVIQATKWMKLKNIMPGERSQLQRTTYYMISFI